MKKDCAYTRKSLRKYLHGHLFKPEQFRVERHLRSCVMCHTEYQALKQAAETKEYLKRNNPKDARLLNLEFHRIIAQASDNAVILFMIDSIMDIMENNISSILLSAESVESTLRFHEEIYQAIKNHHFEKAQDLMLRHIQEIQRTLEVKQRSSAKDSRKERSKKIFKEEVLDG